MRWRATHQARNLIRARLLMDAIRARTEKKSNGAHATNRIRPELTSLGSRVILPSCSDSSLNLLLLAFSANAFAGLYYSGESFADCPEVDASSSIIGLCAPRASRSKDAAIAARRHTWPASRAGRARQEATVTADELATSAALSRLASPEPPSNPSRCVAQASSTPALREPARVATLRRPGAGRAALDDAVRLALRSSASRSITSSSCAWAEGRQTAKPEAVDDLFG